MPRKSRAEQPPTSETPRPTTARGGMCKIGLAIQLSQGQGRQPLSPEGAPQAVGVRCSRVAMARVWVRDIVRLASAGVNTLTVTTPAVSSPALSLCSIRFCRKVRFLGQNPKIGCQEFNNLQTHKLSKKQLCDRTEITAQGPCRFVFPD
jgi:hypothetical protein